jgi:hypothetical protein
VLFALAGDVTMMFIAAIIMGIGTGVAGPAPAPTSQTWRRPARPAWRWASTEPSATSASSSDR